MKEANRKAAVKGTTDVVISRHGVLFLVLRNVAAVRDAGETPAR